VSIAGVSSSALQALLDSQLPPVSTSNTGQTSSTSAVSSSTSSSSPSVSSVSSLDPLTQDLVSLLKALASGDVTGAKADLAQLQKDLTGSSDSSSDSNSSSIAKDLTSFLQDLTSGNTSAAKSDLAQLSTDVKAEEAGASTSSNTNGSPLDQLVGKLSGLLNSGSTEGALQAVASYLVKQGHGTGTLVDTSA
jgi:hypothetical protein